MQNKSQPFGWCLFGPALYKQVYPDFICIFIRFTNKVRKLLIILFLLLVQVSLHSQNTSRIDSLNDALELTTDSAEKGNTYYQLARSYRAQNDTLLSINAGLNAADLLLNLPPSSSKVNNYTVLGLNYFDINNLVASEKYHLLAIEEAKKLDSLVLEFWATVNLVIQFRDIYPATRLAVYMLQLKEKSIQQNNDSLLFRSYQQLCALYTDASSRPATFKEYPDKMLEIAKQRNDTNFYFVAYFYKALNAEPQQAVEYYEKALKLLQGNLFNFTAISNNLSLKYKLLGDYEKAIEYADSAYAVSRRINRQEGMAAGRLNAADAYLNAKNYDNAIAYASEALEIFKRARIIRRQNECARILSEAYKAKKDFENALMYHELEVLLLDSFKQIAASEEVRFVESKFELELEHRKDSAQHARELAIHALQLQNINERLEKEQVQRYALIGGGLLLLLLAGVLTVGFMRKRRDHRIIEQQKRDVEAQKLEIEIQHEEITDSIKYAKRIQNAILPAKELIGDYLPNSFIFYQPKAVVAGDFYWMEPQGDSVIFAAADCTGHGVPGAMVSVVCHNALNRSVREFKHTNPAEILDKTRELVIETFEASDKEVKDGMDIALCNLNRKTNTLQFAGANNPLWVFRKGITTLGQVEEIKADKQPIGKQVNPRPYTSTTIQLNPGDSFYIFSDGFPDQFGGPKGKKFKYKPFCELLLNCYSKPMKEQLAILSRQFEDWKGDLEQVDDVCIIGVRV